MPIAIIPAEVAIATRRSNAVAGWPNRKDLNNRVEPICCPMQKAEFTIAPGDCIYTIGSCFARNVEVMLENVGFEVPVRAAFARSSEFTGMSIDTINVYGAPSVFWEISWAIDPNEPYDYQNSIIKVEEGRYVDVNLAGNVVRPSALELAVKRREAVIRCNRTVLHADVVIVTLGLAEVWFDNVTGRHINYAPLPRMVSNQPGRFEIHVLGYEDVYDFLERTIQVLNREMVHSYNMLLTVSPVPLNVTHRDIDVVVANTYSKSVLRAATEAICERYAHVHYFSSYESVMLSDRKRAWMDDQRHVTREVIKANMDRMVAAYAPEVMDSAAESSAVATLRAKYQAYEKRSGRARLDFLLLNGDIVKGDSSLAHEVVTLAIHLGDLGTARAFIGFIGNEFSPMHRVNVVVETYVGLGEFERAREALESVSPDKVRDKALYWRTRTRFLVGIQAMDEAVGAAQAWSQIAPKSAQPYRVVAEGFKAAGNYVEAARHLEQALHCALDVLEQMQIQLDLAEIYLSDGRVDRAADELRKVQPQGGQQQKQYDRLARFV